MRICVYCGSSNGRGQGYLEAAYALGAELAKRGIEVVYGGATVGMMGALADGAMSAGGTVIGVIPKAVFSSEVPHRGISELHVVENMHERKAMMAELSDAFVALPGGAGTLEELFEMWTWSQIGIHTKPIGVLNFADYYAPLRRFVDHMVDEELLASRYRDGLIFADDVETLLAGIAAHAQPAHKYADRPKPLDVLAWIHIHDRRLLSVRSGQRDRFYLPGGKREPGESDVAAINREISEELNVKLRTETLSFVAAVTAPAHGYADRQDVRMVCYSGEFDGSLSPSAEITELAWLTHADADKCPPAGRRVLSQLHERGLID